MFGPWAETLRRHHALEHATIALLVGRLPPGTRLMGLAIHDGFCLLGNVSTEAVEAAATEALARLKAGESSLAVSPSCGTNLAVTGIMAGVASILALGQGPRWRHLPDVMTAA
ncbi:MAG TPA: DUF6391 domain-containing protein, partial [Dehalococcoidia bacterium]|nr:DUF6391 domain-containing protein [Dehalococcoidia bacterium]